MLITKKDEWGNQELFVLDVENTSQLLWHYETALY